MTIPEFRKEKDEYFRSPESPLEPEQQATFKGLVYFPENPELRFELPLDTNVPHEVVSMQTSTGSQRQYTRAGKIRFMVKGEPVELSVFETEDEYFMPFRDGTSDNESYSAGRYLEPRKLSGGKVLVDFNFAYNPYCAYNENYSCPIPPKENWTNVRIEAGEKKFHE